MLRIISFYTPRYAGQVERLISSVREYGYPAEIEAVDEFKSWEEAVRFKPEFIRRKLKDGPVIWIDADGEIKGGLGYFWRLKCDISAHRIKGNDPHILIATVYFNNNDRVNKFLDLWEEKNKDINSNDERNFGYAVDESGIDFVDLPAKYAKIFDLMAEVEDERIVHYQASRKFREVQGEA